MSDRRTLQLTDWFPPHIKPVHVGEYSASSAGDPDARRWWNGHAWSEMYYGFTSPKIIAERRVAIASPGIQNLISWCGLAEKPK